MPVVLLTRASVYLCVATGLIHNFFRHIHVLDAACTRAATMYRAMEIDSWATQPQAAISLGLGHSAVDRRLIGNCQGCRDNDGDGLSAELELNDAIRTSTATRTVMSSLRGCRERLPIRWTAFRTGHCNDGGGATYCFAWGAAFLVPLAAAREDACYFAMFELLPKSSRCSMRRARLK